jgi:anti-sigma factor RsiW
MKHEAQLKLQAYLDGELPSREAAEVKAWLARDAEAQALLKELENTGAALTGHEAELKVPETRDFYWSKIARDIERQSRQEAPARVPAWWAAWLWRSLIPAGALALVCTLVLRSGISEAAPEFAPELEVASDDVGAYTFRNQETGLTMIWLYDRDGGKAPANSGSEDSASQ